MEKKTSEIFKKWQKCSAACRSVKHDAVAQGTAEDRVTAVNNELARTSLTRGVSVFDENGKVISDLALLLTHLKGIKVFLDQGNHLEERNKYGIDAFVPFVRWLQKNLSLNTVDAIRNYLSSAPTASASVSSGGAHAFSFPGGELLRKMAASWFVSYAYFEHIDPMQKAWKSVTENSRRFRTAKYRASRKMHHDFLTQIIAMSDARLAKNELNLSAADVKDMAKKLLKVVK